MRPCIDLIDSLRALGVEQDLALPAIAVIGDQSSGKSSVLEALSGVALPRGSGKHGRLLRLLGTTYEPQRGTSGVRDRPLERPQEGALTGSGWELRPGRPTRPLVSRAHMHVTLAIAEPDSAKFPEPSALCKPCTSVFY